MSASGKSSNRLREQRRAEHGGGGNGPYAAEGRRLWEAKQYTLDFGVPIGAPEQLDNNRTDKEDSST